MRKHLVIAISSVLLAACAAMHPHPRIAHQVCPADPGEWTVMPAPPAGAAELVAAANPDLSSYGHGRTIQLFWFQNQTDSLLLCRTAVDRQSPDPCGASAWHFDRIDGKWVLRADVYTVVVCGESAGA